MKRYLFVGSVIVCMAVFLVGCNGQTAKESPKDDSNVITSSSASKTDKTVESNKPTQTKELPQTQSTEDSKAAETVTSNELSSTTKHTDKQTTSQVTSPAKKEEQPKVDNAAPQKTNPSNPEPPKQELVKEEPPAQAEPVKEQPASFDVSPYVNYAISYAQSIGLDTGTVATDCWDNPISANAGKKNIKADIQSRMNRYKNVEGCTGVWVWTTKESESDYLIYIGYY
ncbi:MAG: hypothetical protein PHX08_10680 [Lachnospiraceae bacterium]|nr:hypothetical protein [Lachnospiraceae bacterium]